MSFGSSHASASLAEVYCGLSIEGMPSLGGPPEARLRSSSDKYFSSLGLSAGRALLTFCATSASTRPETVRLPSRSQTPAASINTATNNRKGLDEYFVIRPPTNNKLVGATLRNLTDLRLLRVIACACAVSSATSWKPGRRRSHDSRTPSAPGRSAAPRHRTRR